MCCVCVCRVRCLLRPVCVVLCVLRLVLSCLASCVSCHARQGTKLEMVAYPGVKHEVPKQMVVDMVGWFECHLSRPAGAGALPPPQERESL